LLEAENKNSKLLTFGGAFLIILQLLLMQDSKMGNYRYNSREELNSNEVLNSTLLFAKSWWYAV
jgi:hypothetical protein